MLSEYDNVIYAQTPSIAWTSVVIGTIGNCRLILAFLLEHLSAGLEPPRDIEPTQEVDRVAEKGA
jgi:hypothetical protein